VFYTTIKVKKPVLLIGAIIRELCEKAYLSIEGNLTKIDRECIKVYSEKETSLLKRNTLKPLKDFIILEINEDTKDEILRMLEVIGIKKNVLHLQIENDGELILGAYDNFEFVGTSKQINEDTLNKYIQKGIIKSYQLNKT